jgi:hypothetical protein
MNVEDAFRYTPSSRPTHTTGLINEILDEVFQGGFVDDLIREGLEQQFEAAGVSVEPNTTLPGAPYSWNATDTLKQTWPVFVADTVYCNDFPAHPQDRSRMRRN